MREVLRHEELLVSVFCAKRIHGGWRSFLIDLSSTLSSFIIRKKKKKIPIHYVSFSLSYSLLGSIKGNLSKTDNAEDLSCRTRHLYIKSPDEGRNRTYFSKWSLRSILRLRVLGDIWVNLSKGIRPYTLIPHP